VYSPGQVVRSASLTSGYEFRSSLLAAAHVEPMTPIRPVQPAWPAS
jgi:hypothetical protein